MEVLSIQAFEDSGVMIENQEDEKSKEQEDGGLEASSPMGSTTEEETDEDSEPEPPPVLRRKVSFADAFGLDLVSVKEFDNAEVAEPEVSWSDGRKMVHSSEEFYLSCLFLVPSSPEELDQRLEAQTIELESIELLPGTTTLRGIIRVLNLCYSKNVYTRITLDRWRSYFDLLAEYVPGSSDRRTDRFTFKYTLVPPFEKGGTRVEFCLRYETPVGTFWANNQEMNYVLFCHQKGQTKESVAQTEEESSSYKNKRSCLKANRNGDAEENTKGTISTNKVATDVEAVHKIEKPGKEMMDATGMLPHSEEHRYWVESVKNRRRATRLARVQDYLSKTRPQQPTALPQESVHGQTQPGPRRDPSNLLHDCLKIQSSKSPQVLTYHQIPLLTLDWNNDPPQKCGTADVDEILTGRPKMTLSSESEEKPVNDTLETTDEASSKETSVNDVWQVFLNGSSCKDRSDVPESEWDQTAALVSPSDDEEPQIQYSAESGGIQVFQAGTYTPTALHAIAACQVLSGACEPASATVALNATDYQPEEACVSSPGDDCTATQDASQRSEMNSITDTPQEFSLKRAPPLSEDSDSPTECHRPEVWKRESEEIIAARIEGDEPFTLNTADLVTDMTAMLESHNASAVDMISQGARQDEGLSSNGEREVTDTAHNAADDMLAFRETVRQETKHGARCDFSTSRQGAEEEIVMNYTEKKVPTGVEIFRPKKSKECNISSRYAEETQCKEFEQYENSKNKVQESESDGNQIEPALLGAGEFDPNQMSVQNYEQNGIYSTINQEEVETVGLQNQETEGLAGRGKEGMEILDEQEYLHKEEQVKSSAQIGEILFLEACDTQSRSIQAGGELHGPKLEDLAQKQTEQTADLRSETGEQVLALNQTGEVERFSCDGRATERKEISPSANFTPIVEAMELKKIFLISHDTPRPYPMDNCNPEPSEVVESRWTHSQQELKSENDNISCEKTPEDVTVKENVAQRDTSTEASGETEEDLSQEDERIAIGKLKIEAMREMMGNVESPNGESKNPWKGQEMLAEVESSPCGEYKKLPVATKDTIAAGNRATLEEAGLGMDFIERFGKDLVNKIWKEVFVQGVQPSSTNTVDEMRNRLADAKLNCLLPDTFDSGASSLTELPTDSDLSLSEDLELTSEIGSNECSSKHSSQSLNSTEQTDALAESDLKLSADLGPDLSAAQSVEPFFESTQAFRQKWSQIKARSVTYQKTDSQTEDCVFARKESFDRSSQPSNKYLNSSEKLEESDALLWWTILYTISHITRLLICTLLVGGFFVTVFIYDVPAFFALYLFSVCWWVYTWKRHRVMTGRQDRLISK